LDRLTPICHSASVNGLVPAWANQLFAVSWNIFLVVLGFLSFSGPLVPLAAILFLKKASMYCFRRNRTLLLQLGSFQAACFLPYALAQAFHEREAHYALIIPFGAGALMFLVTFAYSVHFVVSAIKGHLEEPVC
jgi:hypothetical protein